MAPVSLPMDAAVIASGAGGICAAVDTIVATAVSSSAVTGLLAQGVELDHRVLEGDGAGRVVPPPRVTTTPRSFMNSRATLAFVNGRSNDRARRSSVTPSGPSAGVWPTAYATAW